MTHPFGEVLAQYRARKKGFSQAKLARLVDYDSALITRMSRGMRDLTGPSGRERVIRILTVLVKEGVISTLDEANTLLAAANMPPLYEGLPLEAALVGELREQSRESRSDRLTRHRTNLPAPLTSFIEREKEMVELGKRMRTKRLITLTGVGGCGKTRLAIELAAQMLETFEDGVWWVSLASLRDGAFTPQAVAGVLKVNEIPGQPLSDTLVRHLHEKQLLLVLDNCEHLLADCAQLVETMLISCRQLAVLTTSREALGIMGEVVWLVPPLSLPDKNLSSPDQLLEHSESVRLFCDRAATVAPAFTLTVHNASDVAQICRSLDGIPLALELAASRVKHMTVEQIIARLDDRIGFLASSRPTDPARHQTLRAVIDWSYRLLGDHERAFYRRLSVFAGGWELEAAQHVTDLDERTVFDYLYRFADKSLVTVEHRNGRQRFRMLETIREYAFDMLCVEEMDAGDSARRHHLEYFLALAEKAWPKLEDEQLAWLDRLEADHDNFRVALDWALAQRDSDAALRLVWGLHSFWERRHHFREAREAIGQALAISHPAERTLARGRVLSLNSQGWFNENYLQARPLLEEALQIGIQVGDKEFVAYSLFTLGCNAFHCKDFASEVDYMKRSLEVWQDLGDQAGICRQMAFVGLSHLDNGDVQSAQSFLEEALHLADKIGAKADKAKTMLWLGSVMIRQGNLARASLLIREGLILDRAAGMPYSLVYAIEPFVSLAVAQGRFDCAACLLGARTAFVEAAGMGPAGAEWSETQGFLETVRKHLGEDAFAEAWLKGRAMAEDQVIHYALAS